MSETCSSSEKFVTCPHCDTTVEVLELNCKIFRCGVFKESGEQINPHLPKNECENLVNTGAIYGCGKPFQITNDNPPYVVIKCDYI